MRDVELYRHLLGLETPWTVPRVELNVPEQRVDVWAGHAEDARWPCPECATPLGLYDHAEERVWRHLDSCQFQTYLHARPPRVQCPTHGVAAGPPAVGRAAGAVHDAVRTARRSTCCARPTSAAPPGSCASAGTKPGTSWSGRSAAASAPNARHVPPRLGVDEKAIAKGHQLPDAGVRPGPGDRRVPGGGPQAGEPGELLRGALRPELAGASRRWPWTCGSPTSRRPGPGAAGGRSQDGV